LTVSVPKSDRQNQSSPHQLMKKTKNFSNYQNRTEACNDKTLKRTKTILNSKEETKNANTRITFKSRKSQGTNSKNRGYIKENPNTQTT
jgi:hypothetical protein